MMKRGGVGETLKVKHRKAPTVRLSDFDLAAFLVKAVAIGKKLGIEVQAGAMCHVSISGAGSETKGRHPEIFNLTFNLEKLDWDKIIEFQRALAKIDKDVKVLEGIGYEFGGTLYNIACKYFPKAQQDFEEGTRKVKAETLKARIQAEINEDKGGG